MFMLINNDDFIVLKEFLRDYNLKLHGRDLSAKLNLPNKSVANILNKFENLGLLKYEYLGRYKLFFLNWDNLEVKDYLKIIEIEKKVDFLKKHLVIREFLKSIEGSVEGIVIVFGSYAKALEKEGSDLDLFIVGNCNKREVVQSGIIWGINVGLKVIQSDELIKYIKEKDNLIVEVLKNHVILKGEEMFCEIVVNNRKWI